MRPGEVISTSVSLVIFHICAEDRAAPGHALASLAGPNGCGSCLELWSWSRSPHCFPVTSQPIPQLPRDPLKLLRIQRKESLPGCLNPSSSSSLPKYLGIMPQSQ